MLEELSQYATKLVPIKEIWVSPNFNCRNPFTPESVVKTAKSIADMGGFPFGLQVPLIVQPWSERSYFEIPDGLNYRLLAGHRRLMAVKQLQWDRVPSRLTPDDISEHEAKKINYIENLEREDLNMFEEALGIQKLFPNGETAKVIAQEICRDISWVKRRLVLLRLPLEIQKHFESKRLILADLDVIAPWINDLVSAVAVANRLLDLKLESKEVQQKVKNQLYQTRKPHLRHPRKTKGEIAEIIAYLYDKQLNGLPIRVAAWCAGEITTKELKQDIEDEVRFKYGRKSNE